MSVYIVTGKLGNGKTLAAVWRMREAIRAGCRIATNLDIDLVEMFGKQGRNVHLMRVPDKPSVQDLEFIGRGCDDPDYDEDKFGWLILDELGTWFNARNWQDKTRKELIDWLLFLRKNGWHAIFIIQDISMMDSQARDALAELIVYCRRLDKIRIPYLTVLIKTFLRVTIKMPRVHRAKVVYGEDGLVSDVWWYRGDDLFHCYDTKQKFLHTYPHGTYSVLTPWHTHGRYSVPMTWRNKMRITKIYWKRFQSPLAMAIGLLVGAFFMLVFNAHEAQAFIQKSMPLAPSASAQKPTVSSSHSSSSSTSSVPQNNLETRLAAFVDQLKIVGSLKVNGGQSYQFSNLAGDKYFTTSDLKSMGFRVLPAGDCAATLIRNGHTSMVGCL